MIKLLIKLRPLDKYFFGGQNTFGEDRSEQSYFVRSDLYPQQSTLLGMLRFEILKQHKLLPINKNIANAKIAIGKESFNIDLQEQDFGAIKKISPLFLMHNQTPYCFVSKHENLNIDLSEQFSLGVTQIKRNTLKGYNNKEWYKPLLKNYTTNKTLKLDDILKEHEQVGIEKSKKGQTAENAFFRQIFYSLADAWYFAFIAEIDEEKYGSKKSLSSGLVTMGGEKSVFKMDISEQHSDYFSYLDIPQNKKGKRLQLLSDAKVSPEIYKNCLLAMTDTVNFRNIRSVVAETINYSSLKRGKQSNYNHVRKIQTFHNLLKRGSVLYSDEIHKIETFLKNNNLQNIGFNNYFITE